MSSELQRLATEAELHPLMRTLGGLRLSQEGRQLQARLRQAVADGVEKKAQLAIARAIAVDAMEMATDLDNRRNALAGDNAVLNSVLSEIELNFVQQTNRIQRGSGF